MYSLGERITILVGNGLGRALDNDYFDLKTAMSKACDILTNDAKERLCEFVPDKENNIPLTEEDLCKIQEIIYALERLKYHHNKTKPWIHDDAERFLDEYKKYIIAVANHFFEFDESNLDKELLDKFHAFISKLCNVIKNEKTHIATLNYDKLLYNQLIQNKIFGRMGKGWLVDGLWRKGFHGSNLERVKDHDFGYYLHLHGSPLFYSDEKGKISKDKIPDYDVKTLKNRKHIVLTSFDHKRSVIAKSDLLAVYWDYFKYALMESKKLIIIGYSGCDIHVNDVIKKWVSFHQRINEQTSMQPNADIEIVEHSTNESDGERLTYWRENISQVLKDNNLIRLPSILDYSFED